MPISRCVPVAGGTGRRSVAFWRGRRLTNSEAARGGSVTSRLWRTLVVGAAIFAPIFAPNRVLADSVSASASRARARVSKVERYGSDDSARIVVHLDRPIRFRPSSKPGAATGGLVVDLEDAAYEGVDGYELEGLVRRIRFEPLTGGLRIAMHVREPAQHRAFYLPSPFRVVVDVSRLPARGSGPSVRGRTVTRIALDPGHGGVDPGAKGPGGLSEKDLVLDIAHRTAPLLARELGVATLLTRDVDARVPLEERVARANAFGADLFISIHCNADRSGSARGVMTFVLDGARDTGLIRLTERENGAPVQHRGQLQRFASQFRGSATTERSTVFANLLQRATMASLWSRYPDSRDGGVHGAAFYVLAGARMPAVLFETSFVSHPVEEARLGTEAYRQKLSDGIVNAVRAYRAGYAVSARPRRRRAR